MQRFNSFCGKVPLHHDDILQQLDFVHHFLFRVFAEFSPALVNLNKRGSLILW